MSQENVEIIRRAYEDFTRTGDITLDRYDREFVFEDLPGAPQPIRRGPDEFQQWARDIREVFGDFVLDPEELIDAGDRVIAIIRAHVRGRTSGMDFEQPLVVVWTVRDGKVVRGSAFSDRAEALQAAGVQPQRDSTPD